MTKSKLTLKSALIGAGLAVVATLGATGTASAERFSFGFSIGERGGPQISARLGDRRGYIENRHRSHRTACTPRRAVRKARNMGIRHAKLRRYSSHGAVISGRYHGERVKVRFNRNCRVQRIAYR